VENYPGFPEPVSGPGLVEQMQKQAERFGARVVIDEVTRAELAGGPPFRLTAHGGEYEAEAVVIATGSSPHRLGVPGEEALIGRGVSFCATCDGFFFRGKDVVVIGGGDSALEEGLFLTKFATRVRIIHRRDELRAGETLKRRALANDKVSFIWDSVVEEIRGQGKVEGVRIRNLKSGEASDLTTEGVFIFIGHFPNSDIFKGQLAMDDHGYLITDKLMTTSIPGVFAAGEIQDPIYRQVASSVGQGCQAAMSLERWLAARE
jgi:thioredoxin reductase (NADPH)